MADTFSTEAGRDWIIDEFSNGDSKDYDIQWGDWKFATGVIMVTLAHNLESIELREMRHLFAPRWYRNSSYEEHIGELYLNKVLKDMAQLQDRGEEFDSLSKLHTVKLTSSMRGNVGMGIKQMMPFLRLKSVSVIL